MIAYPHRGSRQISHVRGFTIIELVMVIVLLGILSVVVMPRFANKAFDERGFHDAAKSVLQHARHVAVASRRFVCVDVNVTTGVVSLTHDVDLPEGKASIDCNVDLALPASGRGCSKANQVCAPSGVNIGGTASLFFDPLGRLVSAPGTVASAASITISNQPNITVAPATGYIE